MTYNSLPQKEGLYDPRFEHDACGMGFVASIKGKASREIVDQALEVLQNLEHRGARGAEKDTGDGAGILLQIPHDFLQKECKKLGFELPETNNYGVGMVFLPQEKDKRQKCIKKINRTVEKEGQQVLGWRRVPIKDDFIGQSARKNRPYIKQIFIGRSQDLSNPLDFERKLYVIGKQLEQNSEERLYFASLSYRTIVYKGMLTSCQLKDVFLDLQEPEIKSAIALVHSRFSTNTFPSWERAHPNHFIIHNGEINTLRGNINWMRARESVIESDIFGEDLEKIKPIIDQSGSDSAVFDDVLEFLTLAGRSLPEAVMMMIPEPWDNHNSMSETKKNFYEYHSCLMEPWDGPAAIGFSDGRYVGGVLDRNGLRPSRYYVTKDDLVIMSSEVGVLDLPEDRVARKQRLEPGRMLLVDTKKGQIIEDEKLKEKISRKENYGDWLKNNLLHLEDLPEVDFVSGELKFESQKQIAQEQKSETTETNADLETAIKTETATKVKTEIKTERKTETGTELDKKIEGENGDNCKRKRKVESEKLVKKQRSFGYTFEEVEKSLKPMAEQGIIPVGSMGNDSSLAVLSPKPQLLYSYFKQHFAQVTNPPIDSIREKLITSTRTYLGSEGDLINPGPENCRQLAMESPILTDEQLEKINSLDAEGLHSARLPIFFNPDQSGEGLEQSLEKLFSSADDLIDRGMNILILSDRGEVQNKVPLPALLAVAGLHHHLIRQGTRTSVSIVLESGEPREIHHFSVLLGYGVDAVNPYLVYESLQGMIEQDILENVDYKKAEKNYVKAVTKGIVKVMAKMGISTVQSYRGAQIFEALGLSSAVIDKYFTWTPSRVEGIGLDEIAKETNERYNSGEHRGRVENKTLEPGSDFTWRKNGQEHLFNPESIYHLQQACRQGDYDLFKNYSQIINQRSQRKTSLRGWLKLDYNSSSIPLEEVESVDAICKRFKTGAMSYGSISQEAHETLAIAMNRIGGKSNTGEGGEDPERYTPDENGDSRCSAIKQVASGRFGVNSNYLMHAREIQIKMAQGAKPGEGGQLPGKKVYPWIAEVRGTTPGVGLISPPPHHDIYSIEDLAELIYDLKNANQKANINVKLVSEAGVGTIAAGVAKGKADVILISGHDGGTGASPRTSIQNAGLPWELGVAETHQTLVKNRLRSRVKIETDGKLMTGRDLVIAALLGAEEYGFATGPLVSMGCVMMRVCNLDTCPVGVATQNPELRKKFPGKPEHVVNFMHFIAREMREEMAALGFRTVDEMIGRVDKLQQDKDLENWKARGLDLSKLLFKPESVSNNGVYFQESQNHEIDQTRDVQELMELARPALEEGKKVEVDLEINNVDRVMGTVLGSKITEKYGAQGLPENTIKLNFTGSAGQSFGAFIPRGMTMFLEGDANDYIGKGLSGGKIVVQTPAAADFSPTENILIGNVAFFGGTSGQAYINGVAGERFCVRNSGIQAVVEGVGDHGCEYMTGGRVLVLGQTGRNFAAGMTGGVAYVLDLENDFNEKCNQSMVKLGDIEKEDEVIIKEMLENHLVYTNSARAQKVLAGWDDYRDQIVRVMPRDYQRMTETISRYEKQGLPRKEALMEAFNENINDQARVGGN
ncbi:MAG: glutamate synthase large subunit [Bacillota bacterium]